MQKIIITGSKGFIGSNVFQYFTAHGFDVTEINEDIITANYDWGRKLREIFAKNVPSCVFHIGACSNTLENDVNYMMVRNYEFTATLSDLCVFYQVPMIYSSSAANYGFNGIHPENLYGWSKYVSEQYVLKSGYGLALRYFNVYGIGEQDKGDMASLAYQMMTKHKRGEDIRIFPNKPSRDFVYINDVVAANVHAFKNFYRLQDKYYDVGSGESRTFEDVANILGIPYQYVDDFLIPKGYQFYTKSDPSKWMKGWYPKYNLETGLREYQKLLQ